MLYLIIKKTTTTKKTCFGLDFPETNGFCKVQKEKLVSCFR